MPRQARKDLGTPFLHVMVQGVNKEYIFYKEEYIEKYLDIIAKKIKDFEFEILEYCIMNNHAHFLVYTQDINQFGRFMQKVNLIYAQMYNREEKRCGVLFRNRYQTEPIYNTKYLNNCIKYIHNNPVKANMVEKCEEYKYSSYNDYINNVGLSQTNIMKNIFGNNCDYFKLFNQAYEKRYMDTDSLDEYIVNGISEFYKEEKIQLSNIFFDRETLMNVIEFLNKRCGIKYIEMRNYFEIPRGMMDKLKIK